MTCINIAKLRADMKTKALRLCLAEMRQMRRDLDRRRRIKRQGRGAKLEGRAVSRDRLAVLVAMTRMS